MLRRWRILVRVGVLSLLAMIVLAACAAPAAAPVQEDAQADTVAEAETSSTLRVGIYAYMTNGIPFDKAVARFEEAHPNVDVEVLPIPSDESNWQAMTQKLQLEAQKESSSWDIIIGMTPFVEPGALAQLGLIDPLDDILPQDLFDDMYGGVREEIKYTGDGKSYVFPWWTDVFGLIYRPSLLQEALGTDEPPTTWDEVLEYCEGIEAHYGDEIACFGADWPLSHRMFLPILGTLTDQAFVEPGVFNLEDEAAVETLALMRQLYDFMPATSAEDLGSSKAFQAGGVAMEIYWQPQLLRALQAGLPEDDVKMAAFPKGDRVNTIFWTAGAVIPKYSENKDAAVRFMLEGLLDETTVRDSVFGNFKVVPYKSIFNEFEAQGEMPAWAPPLLETVEVGQPIPSNPYFLTVEQPAFKDEVERMMLQDQSPEDTVANLQLRIQEGLAELE